MLIVFALATPVPEIDHEAAHASRSSRRRGE
jgi:hypothetical protein